MKFTVKQARLMKGVTQQKMADFLNVHIDTYRKIEKNPDAATVDQAKKISTITGFPFGDIFFTE